MTQSHLLPGLRNQISGDNTQRIASDVGLLLLRLAVGVVFIAHGWGDASQEGGAGANVANYRDAGIPLPELTAWYGAYVQLIGGIVILAGALTRLVSFGFATVMMGALFFVHSGEPLVMGQDGSGSGFAFIMLAASLALLGTGAGRLSLDRVFSVWRARSSLAAGASSRA